MKEYDLTWEDDVASEWGNGAFIGNGLLGAMIYGDRDDPRALQWELGRTDVCAHYHIEGIDWNMPRVFIGELVLKPAGQVVSRSMRLDIGNAEASGTIATDCGRIDWRSFIPRTEDVVIIEVHTEGGEDAAELTFRERWGVSPRIYDAHSGPGTTPERLPPDILPPRPQRGTRDSMHTVVQPLTKTGAFAVAYSIQQYGPHHRVLTCGIDQSHDPSTPREMDAERALDKAVGTVKAALSTDLAQVESGHRQWWREYYRLSHLELPDDPQWEKFFWIQLYKFGSAARPDVGVVIDQLGPWMTMVSWPATWWNINMQVAYYPGYATNHLDISQSLVTAMNRMYRSGSFRQNTPASYRHDSIYVGRSTSVDGIGSECEEGANLLWALHNYWLQWKYSMDHSLIDYALLPMLEQAVNYLLHIMYERDDGRLHLPPMISPEYTRDEYEDTTYALSLLRWALETLLELDKRFQRRAPKRATWASTLAKLQPLPVDNNGYMIAPNVPFAFSHRHFSHLLAMYPLHLLQPTDVESEKLFRASLEHWVNLGRGEDGEVTGWCSFSFPAASAMYSMLGEGENAYAQLCGFGKTIERNTMLLECGSQPSLETPLMAVEALAYMLLQSWGDTIRIFPAVPDKWQDVSFRDFRAQGAFLVSAVREAGKTRSVEVKSLAGEPLRLMPNLPCSDKDIAVEGPRQLAVARSGGCLTVDLRQGETATFRAP